MRLPCYLIASLFWSVAATAQAPNPAELTRRLNDAQADMSQCVAYFHLISRCLKNTPNGAETGRAYEKAADDLLIWARKAGEILEMTEDAIQSRLSIAVEAMMTLVNKNCVNISSAMKRYSDKCTGVVQAPLKGIQEMLPKQ